MATKSKSPIVQDEGELVVPPAFITVSKDKTVTLFDDNGAAGPLTDN